MLWAGVFAFAIQIYADFSAYTDIARGSSRWLGFELTENFDHPYLARNAGRLLAALEHLALDAGSATTSTSRSAARARRGGLGAQRPGDVPAVGPLARRELELRALGAVSRRVADPDERRIDSSGRATVAGCGAAKTVGMFSLGTLIGWLLFRETDLSAIVRDLPLSPAHDSAVDCRSASTCCCSPFLLVPLWAQSLGLEAHRGTNNRNWPRGGRSPSCAPWPRGVALTRRSSCFSGPGRRWTSFTFSF